MYLRESFESSRHGVKSSTAARVRSTSFPRLFTLARREFSVPLIVILSALLLQMLAAMSPALTQHFYSGSLYPYVVFILSSFSRNFEFSIGEALTCFILAVILACITRFGFLLYLRPESRRRRMIRAIRFTLWCVAACLWTFMLSFGLNYQRPLLYELLGFERRQASATELEAISSEVVRQINENYQAAHAPGAQSPDREEITRLLEESYNTVPELSLLPRGVYAEPKPVYFSEVMTRMGIGGFYLPFTGEPNYNARMPDFQLPFTMAHEMAHQRGVARESEANFIAFLACVNSGNPFVRYSGYRNGLGVLNELYRVEPEKGRAIARQLAPGFREDSRRAAMFWAKSEGAAGALSYRINDLYLRANRVRSGVADYTGSTQLIIGYYLRSVSHAQ